MFERMEERRAGRARSIAIGLGVVTAAAVAIVKLVNCHFAAEVAEQHASYVAETRAQEQPREDAFAGLSARLPGEPGIRETDRYANGRVVGGRPFEYTIEWAEGSMSGAAARTKWITALVATTRDPAAKVPAETAVPGELHAFAYELHWDPGISLPRGEIVTLFDCDGRYVVVEVDASARAGNDALVASMRCVPDPAAHSTTARFPVVVDSATGWKRIDSPDELELVGPGGAHLHAKLLPRGDGSVYDTIEHAAGRVQLRPGTTTRGDKVFMTGWLADDGSAATGREVAVLGFRCPDGDVATITIIGKPPLDPGIVLGDTARCLGADDAMPQYEK